MRCFPLNIAKFLRTPAYFEEHLLGAASDFFNTATEHRSVTVSVLYWLFYGCSNNLLTGYEQLSC